MHSLLSRSFQRGILLICYHENCNNFPHFSFIFTSSFPDIAFPERLVILELPLEHSWRKIINGGMWPLLIVICERILYGNRLFPVILEFVWPDVVHLEWDVEKILCSRCPPECVFGCTPGIFSAVSLSSWTAELCTEDRCLPSVLVPQELLHRTLSLWCLQLPWSHPWTSRIGNNCIPAILSWNSPLLPLGMSSPAAWGCMWCPFPTADQDLWDGTDSCVLFCPCALAYGSERLLFLSTLLTASLLTFIPPFLNTAQTLL